MNAAYARRAYPRNNYEAPIMYARIGTDQYMDSRIYNYSRNGMYFEPKQPLSPESDVVIVMVNYTPGTFGPESYRSYAAKIRWCREIPKPRESRFGVGAELYARSHEIIVPDVQETMHTCDLCGELCPSEDICQTEDWFMLCGNCDKHMTAMPGGMIKDSIHRFLTGNVL